MSKSKRESNREGAPTPRAARAMCAHATRGPRLTKAQLEAWASFSATAWAPFKEAWFGRGLRLPPTAVQRRVLWPLVDARPNDVGQWVSEAPRRQADEIIGYVLGRWDAFRAELEADIARRRLADMAMDIIDREEAAAVWTRLTRRHH